MRARVQALVQQVQALTPRPALVVVTGDLVMDSARVKDETFIRQVFGDYLQAFRGLALPLLQVPGNHDHPGAETDLPPDAPLYGVRGYEALVGPAWYSLDWAGVHLVALDSTELLAEVQDRRAGLSDVCRAWLQRDLALVPPERPLLIFSHHPPETWRDWPEVAALLAGRRVLGIFCGHTHVVKQYEVGGIPVRQSGAISGQWWLGPCPDGNPRGFRVLRVTAEGADGPYLAATEE